MNTNFDAAVVIDNGSEFTKGGLSDTESPAAVFHTQIGYRHPTEAKNLLKYVGYEHCSDQINSLSLSYPIQRGIVTNWDEMQEIWSWCLDRCLKVERDKYPILLTETPLNPNHLREKSVEIILESIQAPAVYLADKALLSLFSEALTSGLVIGSGGGVTYTAPVYECHTISIGVCRLALGGRDLTNYLAQLLSTRGFSFSTNADMEIAAAVKSRIGFVALDFEEETRYAANHLSDRGGYELPDGRSIQMGSAELFSCAEPLFQPSLLGVSSPGIHKMVASTLSKCDPLIQSQLTNVLFTGGSTAFPGISGRVTSELASLSIKIVQASQKHENRAWSGGAILASVPSFANMWICQTDYEEYGAALVRHKCI